MLGVLGAVSVFAIIEPVITFKERPSSRRERARYVEEGEEPCQVVASSRTTSEKY
jgi:hypothetical protein